MGLDGGFNSEYVGESEVIVFDEFFKLQNFLVDNQGRHVSFGGQAYSVFIDDRGKGITEFGIWRVRGGFGFSGRLLFENPCKFLQIIV